MYHSPVAVLCYDVLCVCSTGEEVDEEYRANHEMELILADLLHKADIAAVGLEERARLEAEKDEILCQLSKDVDFDLSRARKIGTIGDQTVCGRLQYRFRCATGSRGNWSSKPRCMSRINHKILKSTQNPKRQLVTSSGLVRTATQRLLIESWSVQVARRWRTATIGARRLTGSSTRKHVRTFSRKTTKNKLGEDLRQFD